MLLENGESSHAALIKRQPHADIDTDTRENIPFSHRINFTSAVQDGEPCMYATVVGHGSDHHHGRRYKICVTKWPTSLPGPEDMSKPSQLQYRDT